MVTRIESNQDLEIYKNNSHARVFAGPGAGKTHLLIENIKHIVENSRQIKNGMKKILCITYTNAAVDEIMQRLGSYNKYVFTSTIHSFINEYILKQFQSQLKQQIKNDFKIIVPDNISIVSQREGLTTLSEVSKTEIFEFIEQKYSSIQQNLYTDLSKKKMSDVVIDISPINQVNSVGNEEVKINENGMSRLLSNAIKDFTWSIAGKLAFDEILYFGWKLVQGNEIILHLLRVEFPYIMIDEYQDTNPLQNILVRKISEKGVIVTVVGDIAQSIYSFQGASYLDFKNFNLPSALPINDYVIEGNRRSTENIIKVLNYIRKDDNNLNKQFCAKNIENNNSITFIIQRDRKRLSRPIRDVIGANTRILCRKWSETFMYVDDIEQAQKELLSSINNTYTYRLSRDLFTEVEAKQENWIDTACSFNALQVAQQNGCLPSFLETIKRYVKTEGLFVEFTPEKAQKLNVLIQFWNETFSNLDETMLLKDIVPLVNEKLHNTGLEILEEFTYPQKNDDEYFEPIYKYVDKLTYATTKKIINEIFVEDSNYMTIHRAKGKEFDSVFVNGDPFAREEDIAQVLWVLNNPTIISETPDANTFVREEYTRLLYVGYSRAINKLYIHLYGDKTIANEIDKSMHSYFGDNANFYNFEYC